MAKDPRFSTNAAENMSPQATDALAKEPGTSEVTLPLAARNNMDEVAKTALAEHAPHVITTPNGSVEPSIPNDPNIVENTTGYWFAGTPGEVDYFVFDANDGAPEYEFVSGFEVGSDRIYLTNVDPAEEVVVTDYGVNYAFIQYDGPRWVEMVGMTGYEQNELQGSIYVSATSSLADAVLI